MILSKQESKIGKNIRKYRKRLSISQDVLSKRTNLAYHTIAKIEAGSTKLPEKIKRIYSTIPKFIDEYNWVTITKGWSIPIIKIFK